MVIERELYVNQIKALLNNEQIKVITGVRRCGKSYLLDFIVETLKKDGVDDNHIIKLSMEDMAFDFLREPEVCHKYLTDKMVDDKKYFILIDEVQIIKEWERVVNSLRLKNTSIVITGSNSKVLSGELSTLLSGRYVEFQLRTIAFSEYYNSLCKSGKTPELRSVMEWYIENGGYPIIASTELDEAQRQAIVTDIFHSTVLKDVINRNSLKDEALMERLVDYLLDNVGNLISIRKIVDYLNGNGNKTNVQTISNYIKALERAFIIEKVSRYDIKGKELLMSVDKYFVADHSLMYVRKGNSFEYIGQVLENIVYNDLKRRGYKVYVGKLGEKEIDFIAEKPNEKIYVQVSYTIANKQTFDREIEPLKSVKDNYKKYLVTMDSLARGNSEGIEIAYLPNFLLKESLS